MLLGQLLTSVTDPLRIVYLFGSILGLDLERAQALLEAPTRLRALRLMGAYLMHEVQALELRQHIADQARTEINQQQREYLLRQQLRAIQAELGEQNLEQAEARSLRQRFEAADLPEETRQEAERELARLEKMSAASPDYHIGRDYLEFILDLPWRRSDEGEIDLARARQALDEDHYDLKELKERILEHLGVLKLNPMAKAPILCFV